MARKDRTGSRKTREQRATRRIPEMGYYLVVTEIKHQNQAADQRDQDIFQVFFRKL